MIRQRQGQPGQQRQPGNDSQQRRQGQYQISQRHADHILDLCGALAQAHGQRVFAALAVVVDVAQVVDHQDGRDDQARRQGHPPRGSGDGTRLHVIRPRHGGQAEEEKDEQVAQAVITERERSARVGDGRQNGRNTNSDDRPAAQPGQVQSQHGRQPEDDSHPNLDLARCEQPRLSDARRPETLGRVGAALEVEHIIGEVAADL